MTVNVSEVHWFWLGCVRITAFATLGLLTMLLLPLTMIACAGGALTIERIDRLPDAIDRFAVWAWRKAVGGEK